MGGYSMYLARLSKDQKEIFLEFVQCLASIDDDFSDVERITIESYCNEMQIEFRPDIQPRPMNEIIEIMTKECGQLEKKIIVFEAIGLAMIDSDYDESERKLIISLMNAFGIEDDFGKKCEVVVSDYIELQNRINGLVLG